MKVSLKITNGATTRRLSIKTSTTFTDLEATLSDLFPWPSQISYKDNDNDLVRLDSQRELEEFFRVATTYNLSPVRIYLTMNREAGAPSPADATEPMCAELNGLLHKVDMEAQNSQAPAATACVYCDQEVAMDIINVQEPLVQMFLSAIFEPLSNADLERIGGVLRRLKDVSIGTREAFVEFLDVVKKGNAVEGTMDAVKAVWPMLMEWVKKELGEGEVDVEKVNELIVRVEGKMVADRMVSLEVWEGLEELFRSALRDEGVVGLLRALRDVNEEEGESVTTSG